VWQIDHGCISVSLGKADLGHINSSELCREALNFATVVSAPFTVNYEHGGRKIATVPVEFDRDWLSKKMMNLAPFWCTLLPNHGPNIASLDPIHHCPPLCVSTRPFRSTPQCGLSHVFYPRYPPASFTDNLLPCAGWVLEV